MPHQLASPILHRLLLLAAAAVIVLSTAPSAAALTVYGSVEAHRLKTKCVGRDLNGKPTIAWRGGAVGDHYGRWYNPNYWAPHGKMYFCYVLYRLGDKTADGDTYAVDLKTIWSESGVWDNDSAIASQYVSSNTDTKDSDWDATREFTSPADCDATFTVSLSAGPISASTSEKVCKGETVSAMRGSKVARWSINRAAKVKMIETAYYQKVKHGAKPTYRIWFTVPYYKYKVTYDSYGDAWWEVTSRAWKDYIYDVSVP